MATTPPKHIQLCPICWGACGDPDSYGDVRCSKGAVNPEPGYYTSWRSVDTLMLVDVIDDRPYSKSNFSSVQPAANLSADGRITRGEHAGIRWARSYKNGRM